MHPRSLHASRRCSQERGFADFYSRDPVAPARRSDKALAKAASHTLDDGSPAHSFSTLMAEMATIVRNTCRTPSAGAQAPTFDIVTTANDKQKRALELIQNLDL